MAVLSLRETLAGTTERAGSGAAVLAADDLTIRYGAVTAVQGVSLQVRAGELVALVGPIGAGKTTIMSALMGLHPPASGRIVFDGEEIAGWETDRIVRHGLALVPERRRLFANLTVRENLWLGQAARGGGAADVAEVLARFPALERRIDGAAGYLSGGEAQQLAIARALLARPRALLLDEPTLGLSPQLAENVFELLVGLRAQGLPILLVEQNAVAALSIADRGYVLAGGRLEREGPAGELVGQRALVETYLGVRA